MLKQIIPPILTSLVGSIIWSIIWYLMVRFGPDEPMIWAIGMIGLLVLIVAGVVGVGWHIVRDKVDPKSIAQLELMTRVTTAVYFSQIYGVTPDELAGTITIEEMEERAKRIQAENRLAELGSTGEGC